jgi:hypothetical protein
MKKCLMLLLLSISLYSCSKEDNPIVIVVEHTPNRSVTTSYQSRQCSGTTLKGLQCKNRTLSPNGRCYLHGGN